MHCSLFCRQARTKKIVMTSAMIARSVALPPPKPGGRWDGSNCANGAGGGAGDANSGDEEPSSSP